MDAALLEFVRLCDAAIDEAEQVVRQFRSQHVTEQLLEVAELTLHNLRAIKDSSVQGTIHRPSDGAGLGLTREVGEWADRMPLFDLVTDVEMFYRYKL